MVITKISPQQKNKDRYNVHIDNEFSFSISTNDLLEQKIAKGDTISPNHLEKLKKCAAKSLLLNKVIYYLSRRPHSIKEVHIYLKQKIYQNKELKELPKDSQKVITEAVLNHLQNKNYLNDKEFAKWLIKQRTQSNNPKGKVIIKWELIRKGINQDIINDLLKDIPQNQELQNAKFLTKKKLKQLQSREKKPRKVKQQLIKYLQGRGFSWEIIKQLVADN